MTDRLSGEVATGVNMDIAETRSEDGDTVEVTMSITWSGRYLPPLPAVADRMVGLMLGDRPTDQLVADKALVAELRAALRRRFPDSSA